MTQLALNGHPIYRDYIGVPWFFGEISERHFRILVDAGLKPTHKLVDIGCGSLRSGRLLMLYLEKGNYFGVEPNQTILQMGIDEEVGPEFIRLRQAAFSNRDDFALSQLPPADYYFAHSVFTHTTLLQLRTAFSELRSAFERGAVLLATYQPGEQDYEGKEWLYPHQSRFRTDTLVRLAFESGAELAQLGRDMLVDQEWIMCANAHKMQELGSIHTKVLTYLTFQRGVE